MADEHDALEDKFSLRPAWGVAIGLVIGTFIWIVIVIVAPWPVPFHQCCRSRAS